jgi:tetratricopeptide (TPR) repeat protein
LAVLEHAPEGGNGVQNRSLLLNQTALNYASRAAYVEAEPLYRRALAVDEASYGPDHPEVARGLGNLAQLLRATNRPGEAEPLMRRALAIFEQFERSTGHRHPRYETVAGCLAALVAPSHEGASASGSDTDHTPTPDADAVPDQAAAETNAPLPEADASMVSAPEGSTPSELDVLARQIEAAGHSPEAERLLRQAITVAEASLGADHPKLAGYLDDLALLLISAERLVEAEPMMRRALAIEEGHLGPDDPNVARLLNNLAQVLKDTGRPSEAAPLMRRVVARLDKFARETGERHPSHEIAADNLAALEAQLAAAPPAPAAAMASGAHPALGTATVSRPDAAGTNAPARPGSKATFLNWMFGRL